MAGVNERVRDFLKQFSVNDRIDALKAERMAQGEKTHGVLNIETDSRDFIQEGIEELIDFLNYIEFAMLQGKIPFCKWVSIDRDVRFTIWRLEGMNEGLFHGDRARGSLQSKP